MCPGLPCVTPLAGSPQPPQPPVCVPHSFPLSLEMSKRMGASWGPEALAVTLGQGQLRQEGWGGSVAHWQGFMPFPLPPAVGFGPAVVRGPAMGSGLKPTMGPLLLAGLEAAELLMASGAFTHFVPTGRASLHDKASLRLEQVRSEDQGWYECKVLMLDQQYDTFHNGSWVHLTINGAYGLLPGMEGQPGKTTSQRTPLRGSFCPQLHPVPAAKRNLSQLGPTRSQSPVPCFSLSCFCRASGVGGGGT